MTTQAADAPTPTEPEPRKDSWVLRWAPLGAVLFVVGMIVAFAGSGDTGETAQEIIDYAEDNEGWIAYLAGFGLLSLLLLSWFVASVCVRLRRAGARTESVFALVGGLGFILMFFAAATIWSASLVELADEESDIQRSQAEVYLVLEDVGWFLLGGAGIGAALMIMAASVGAIRVGAVRAWIGWLGVALGVISLATIAFVGIFAWMLWLLLAGIGMLAREFGIGSSGG